MTVGGTAALPILSGLANQTLFLDIARAGRLTERQILSSERDATLVEIPIGEADRGGFGVTLTRCAITSSSSLPSRSSCRGTTGS